jgi:hypothetical protein
MSRLSDIINSRIDFPDVNTWVDFGTGNGKTVKDMNWDKTAKHKIAIDKFPQLFGDDWKNINEIDLILNNKWDLFTSFDSIEHLTKIEGEILLKKIDPWFKYKLFFTPRGFLQQDETTHPELIKENPWQKHISGWDENDFNRFGYTSIILSNFHYPLGLNKYFDAIISYKID